MKNFDTRVYSIADFYEWDNNDLLQLSPDFQRRAVWSEKAKSYLIDTIVRGRPIPKIIISQKLTGSKTVRVVVDGQQRLRAIIEYIKGSFSISRAHNSKLANLRYEQLPSEMQKEFLQYELGVDLLFDFKYEDLLDIFARINSYTVSLNTQEKLNAKYLGFFKRSAYDLGYRYVEYFLRANIITKAKVTRMAEAELASDLLVALVGGVQTNKKIEYYYREYEDEQGQLDKTMQRFDQIMSYIGEIYNPEELAETNWSRIHLFYTLFTAIGHCLFNLVGLKKSLRVKLAPSKVSKLRVCLDEISATYDRVAEDIDNIEGMKDYKNFIDHSRRRTTDTASRVERADFVCRQIQKSVF